MGAPTAASQRNFQSWGRFPASHPADIRIVRDRIDLPDFVEGGLSVLPYGQGRSYGDVCLNNGGALLGTGPLDRLICFDTESGLLKAEAGTTLADIFEVVVPRGWFLPVSPGTKFVSLGGAVANDIHGKNHHIAGTFGRHVTQFELARSSGERLICSRDRHRALYSATIGGLGLTGLITWVEVQLTPIQSDQIDVKITRFRSLDEFLELSRVANAESPYVVAWIDGLRPEGRGLLMQGEHAPPDSGTTLRATRPSQRMARLSTPFDIPKWVLNPISIRAFNTGYFWKQLSREKETRMHFEPFFYPLDGIRDWNRFYGKRGFLQFQCVVPSGEAIGKLLDRIAAHGAGPFLAVIKTFGDLPSPGIMSFPRSGVTLAMDFAFRGDETIQLLSSLDSIVRESGGAVYPAKDACMAAESFRAYFPRWEEFTAHVDPAFSSTLWRRVIG